jgi:isoleucyl-tRNA synthetase
VVRAVQDARKNKALHIGDRIVARISADAEHAAAIAAWQDYIKEQTLAMQLEVTPGDGLTVSVDKASTKT